MGKPTKDNELTFYLLSTHSNSKRCPRYSVIGNISPKDKQQTGMQLNSKHFSLNLEAEAVHYGPPVSLPSYLWIPFTLHFL